LGADSEAILTSLEGILYGKAKFISKGRNKTLASLCKATLSGKAIPTAPITKKKTFTSQPKGNFQSSRVFVMDQLGSVNTYLRDYLSNK